MLDLPHATAPADLAQPVSAENPAREGRFVAWICLGVVLLTAVLDASAKPLWFDELATYYISGAQDLADVWTALEGAADAHPPLLFVLTRLTRALFGDSELAVRIQAVLGFGLFLSCLFRLIRPRAGPGYGVAAMLIASSSWGFEYAYEARPYALLMGLCALALSLWMRAAEEPRPRAALLCGLAAVLVLMLSSHYYAILLLIPLALGELARTVRRRAVDWAVWVALGLPCLVLPLYLPLVQAVRAAYQEHFFSRPELIDAYGFYLVLLAPAAVPLGLALPAAGIAARGFDPADAGDAAARGSLFRPHELAAVLALALIPLAYVGLAFWTTGAFVYRYPLAALTGVTLVSVDVLHNWLGPRRKAVWTACAVLGGFFLLQRFAPAFENVLNGGNLRRLEIELAAIERSTAGGDPGPVVAATPQAFVQYAHYASPGLRRRLEYWSDPAIALERLQTDSAEYALRNLAPWAGLAVKPYEQARNTVSALYLVEIPGHKYDWITADLEARFGKGEKLLENGTTRLVRLRAR